jgi:O-antigen biosynthesis protein
VRQNRVTAFGWMQTAAMLGSPAYATVTLKNLLSWVRASHSATARDTLRTLFNEEYYLDAHPDVKASGVHPYLHFLFRGFLESRSPSEHLDTAHYLAMYPDVKRAQINPALHYALFGKRERRSAVPIRTRVIEIGSPDQAPLDDPSLAPALRIDNVWAGDCPLVSVVIPCFNYGGYIEDALRSVLAQTFRNFEVIIVEGGSTDGVTPGVIANIEARGYDNVRVLYRAERHFAGDNRNYGISHARGRYICCLDADDTLHPIYLEMAVFLAEGYGYDIVSSSLQCFGGSDIKWVQQDASFPAIAEGNQIATTALFRKSAWVHVGGYRDWGLGQEHIPEDWDFWVRMLGHGYRCKNIREPLMYYRIHGAGLTATCETDRKRQQDTIRRANADLFQQAVTAPAAITIEIVNRWRNATVPADDTPGILVALPFITIGGAEQLFRTLFEGLTVRGLRVVIITTLRLPDTVKEAPTRYNAITPHVYHLPKLLDRGEWEDFVHYLLQRYNIGSLLLAGSEFVYRCLPRIRAEFPHIRIVDQQFNDTGHIENNRRYSALIDCTVVPSKSLAALLTDKFHEQRSKVAVVPHGIHALAPAGDRPAALASSGLPAQSNGKLLISFFGRMSKEKSPEVFVNIAARLSHRNDLYFCMTGEGPEWAAVQRLAAKHGLQNKLHLPGFVDDPRPLMELSDIVVLTSAVDGMPLVVLEAQALGKAVVASAVGSLPEMIIEGETGFLCPPGDVDAFCRAIEELAGSESLRRAFGERARRFVRDRFDAEPMIASYISALTHA